MDKIIKVKVEEVVVVSPGDVELATPEIKVEGQNIIATQKQKGGYVAEGEKTTSIPATELDEDLKPENIAKGVSIFGVEGTKEFTESKPILQEKETTANGIVEADEGYDGLSKVVVDVNPPLQKKTLTIENNGSQTIQADDSNYGLEEVEVVVNVQPTLQEKDVEITENGEHTIAPDEGVDGIKSAKVNVNVQPVLQEKTATENGPVVADDGFYGLNKVVVDVNPPLQTKAVKVENNGSQTVKADGDNYGLSEVEITVNVKPELQEKSETITNNGEHTITPDDGVDGLEAVNITVDVKPNLQSKTATENGTVAPDEGYDGLSDVMVNVTPKLQQWKTIIANGTYTADEGYDGLGKTVVNVKPTLQDKTVEITENGTHAITQDDGSDGLGTVEVVVNVYAKDNLDDFMADTLTDYSNENLKAIRDYAFYNSQGIQTVNAPNLTTIGTQAFRNSSIQSITLEKVTEVGASAFMGSSLCMDVVMNAIWAMTKGSEFQSSGITSFTSTSCNTFNTNTFWSAKNLVLVDLGQQWKSSPIRFNTKIFWGCSSLTAVIIRNSVVASLSSVECFQSTPIETGEGFIYVPDALVEQYKAATNWSTYADQILPLSEYVEK